MKIEQSKWTPGEGWSLSSVLGNTAQLVLVFGATAALKDAGAIEGIRQAYPKAIIFGCSTSGEIRGTNVSDDTLIATAVNFEKTIVKTCHACITNIDDSFRTGETLARGLDTNGLKHVLVLSDGLLVNGSELTRGLLQNLPEKVVVTGGLAGDGSRFQETMVFQSNMPGKNVVSALGFYGDALKVGYGSFGGWDPFGPERLVTKSKGNILYELDGGSALALYKKYLGEYAQGLPATGLLFPLCVRSQDRKDSLVRTILAVNENEQSLTFAGDVPEGAFARFMKANFDRLIDGAMHAAKTALQTLDSSKPELAILISCVGRKLILKQRVEEEIEGVQEVFGRDAMLTGFYSYGEIAPFMRGAPCELHNQTMTITVFSEG